MRNYENFEKYLTRLVQDVYAQPPDEGHTAWAAQVVRTICTIPQGLVNVLDIGCGQGFLAESFKNIGLAWTGVTIGEDFAICKERNLNVHNADMTFLPFEDNSYDLIFARHTLEHSPCPVMTLMEWRRVCRGWMCLVAPGPGHWGYRGKNHYSVMPYGQLEWLLNRAGWNPMHVINFTNRDPEYLKYWKVYQDALASGSGPVGTSKQILRDNPEVMVEYRMLCERIEPEVE